jgi:hypothetical protein
MSGYKREKKPAEKASLENMTKILRDYYQWNETIPFTKLSSQNCSEMIIYLRKLNKNCYLTAKPGSYNCMKIYITLKQL